MKRLILTTVLATFVLSMQAVAQQDIRFGAVGGFNFSKASPGGGAGKYFKMKPGIHLGVFGEKEIQENLSVQAGLTVSGKGYVYKSDATHTRISLTYLEIPINAVYRFNQLFVGAGPYLAYGISGKAKTKSIGLSGSTDIFDDYEGPTGGEWATHKLKMGGNGDFKALDLGLNVLAGYQINSQVAANLGYGLGLANISATGGRLKNRVLSLSVRYMFE